MHRSRALIACLLASLILATSLTPALGATTSDVSAHQQKAEKAREQAAKAEANAKRLADEVEDLDKQIDQIRAQANALAPKIKEAAARTTRLRREVEGLTKDVAETQQRIEETQAEYERQQTLLKDRVNSTYRQGSWFYLDILLGSKSIGELITRTEFVSRVIESNNDLAVSLEATEESLGRSKVKLDRSLQAIKLKQREAAEVESDLREMKAERDRQAAESTAIQDRKEELVGENKANAKRLLALAAQEEAESRRIEAELAEAARRASGGSGVYAGQMSWPVPSSQRVTSPFGWRTHPIFGDRRLHTGIDIGAPSGAAVVAAGAGTVISAGYRGGYGNTIMVDHGEGVVTLYAHLSAFATSVGQSVGRGAQIGSVGSTGNSTGPHLHFEVRVNGVPKNPMNYL
jgi:murein DD-endopeptidase MepM/ murein hydrolase activator NlpD